MDFEIFNGLLKDLFPGIEIARKADLKFEAMVEEVSVSKFGLTPDKKFILKIIQLKELLEIRHCVFLMGPPGSGKSTTWKVLGEANGKFDPTQKTTT